MAVLYELHYRLAVRMKNDQRAAREKHSCSYEHVSSRHEYVTGYYTSIWSRSQASPYLRAACNRHGAMMLQTSLWIAAEAQTFVATILLRQCMSVGYISNLMLTPCGMMSFSIACKGSDGNP